MKATVDAYDGKVTLYAWDTEDPILQTWQKIFPGRSSPADDMSGDLMSHVRYPADLFKVQRAILGTYHVTDAGHVLLGATTRGSRRTTRPGRPDAPTLQPPYYLTMQMPGTGRAVVLALLDLHPAHRSGERRANVLTGYLAVNSDRGTDDYGKLTLLTLPKTDTVPGPGQVQNSFTTDTDGRQPARTCSNGRDRGASAATC